MTCRAASRVCVTKNPSDRRVSRISCISLRPQAVRGRRAGNFGGFAGGVFAVESSDHFLREAHFRIHGMQFATGYFLLQRVISWAPVGHQARSRTTSVRREWTLFFRRFAGLRDADVVAELLDILREPSRPTENRHGQMALARQTDSPWISRVASK